MSRRRHSQLNRWPQPIPSLPPIISTVKGAFTGAVRDQIAALYGIEKEIHGRTPEERLAARNERRRSVLESLKQWLEEILGRLSKKSDTAMVVKLLGDGILCYAAAMM